MNNVFRLIWSRRLGTLVPVPEGLGTAGRKNRRMMRRLRRLMRKMVGPGAAALTLGMLVPLGAQALPTGGQVVAGQAAIAQNGSQMTITQSSDKAIVNWQGFDIGTHEHVTFAQPSTSSVALNRVVDNSASAIYGGMDANGQVFLVNQNGVYFAPGAQVSAGGLLVSTLGISDSDFMAGRLHFSGDSTAGGRNDGTIRAGQGGYVAFIGRHVDNEGHIITPGGKTALGAGGAVDISLSGNALVQFRVSADALDAQVKNGGVIRADNGAVVMSARARDARGVIEARGVRRGAGGTIAIWSDIMRADGVTLSYGTLLAKGGAQGGDGGMIETSGHRLDVTGSTVSTKATAGADGTWLLDPYNLTVTGSSATSASTGTNQPAGADSTILASSLSTALASGNVTIQTTGTSGAQAGDITVDAAIGWSSDNTLTFDAAGNIAVNAAITASGSAPGLALKYGQSSTNGAGASYSINAPVSLTSGASFSTQLGSTGAPVNYTILTDAAALQNINSTGLAGAYALGSDVNLSSIANFTPMGNAGTKFTGQFDGLGHTISNLTINRPMTFYVGLFGETSNATLRNVGLINADVAGDVYVGSLVGYSYNSTINNAYATGVVTGTSTVGGLVGYSTNAIISNAYATGAVSGTNYVGGLVGIDEGSTIGNAYATGAVTGVSNVGGLVGVNRTATISNAYATGAVTGSGSAVGGLAGINRNATISNAYATGAVSGISAVGGLVGANVNNSTIGNTYWDTTTSGQSDGVGAGDGAGVSGLSTAELAAIPPSVFDAGVWSTSDNQTTPWLLANRSFGTVSGSVLLGTDTSATPQHYDVIATPDQLQNINTTGLAGNYVLGQSVDLTSIANFAMIGHIDTRFTGQFDGLGHTISNLTINWPMTFYVGLFGVTSNATLRNVGLVDADVTGSGFVGSLVGKSYNSTINNAYATGRVSGGGGVGGLIGLAFGGRVSNAYATGDVSGTSSVGGLVGINLTATISNAYATGAVTGSGSVVGGLAGLNSNATITNAYATGAVSGTSSVGGLVGSNYSSTITNAYWDTTTSGLADGVGVGSDAEVSGKTTAELAASLSSEFNAGVWSTSDNQTTPWLLANRSFGTVSGHVILGSGSSATPQYYDVIATPDQLQYIPTTGLGGDYVLGQNLDLSSIANFTPIGAGTTLFYGPGTNQFTGQFDGLGHTISNLTINRSASTNAVGLFGYTSNATLRNVGLIDADVTGGSNVGALVGSASNSTISNAYATGTVSGTGQDVGGLVGFGGSSTINNAYATGVVSGTGFLGGLVGFSTNSTINNAYAAGAATGTNDVGGLVGYNLYGTIKNSYATGAVTGVSSVGGLVGVNDVSSTISNAYATGAVTGTGLDVGGLVGLHVNSAITNAYATGAVSGTSRTGGLVGSNYSSTITNAYWDTTTSGLADGVGVGSDAEVSGKTTAELAASSSSEFNTGVWSTSDNQSTPWLLANRSFGTVSGHVILGSDSSATPQHYDVIATPDQLQNIPTTGLGGDYVLGQSVDLTSIANFTPIGASYSTRFSGTFDGLGHTISNLTINRPSTNSVGLFGFTSNATLRNVGLVGGSVTGRSQIGGLVGFSTNSEISNAYATGAVSGISAVGGLVGWSTDAKFSNAYATGTVSGASVVGGLVGMNSNSTINNAYATGAVSGTGDNIGGLVGQSDGTINSTYATGAVSGAKYVGGLIGRNSAAIGNVYATGAVSGTEKVGGLVGGSINTSIGKAYATGAVSGTSYVGGLVGFSTNSAISDAYWDSNATGQSTSAGGTALTSTQMQQQASFSGFDFSATPDWVIYEGHTAPLLAAFMTPLSVSASASHVTYDGTVAGASSITTTVTGTAPAGTLFGNSGTLNNAATPFGNARNVGTYDADLWSDQQGYRITQTGTTLTIDPRSLTGSIAAGSSTYGDVLAPGAASFTNAVSGDDVSGAVAVATTGHLSTSGHLNAGSYAGVESVSGLSGADAGNYSIGTITAGDYTVTRLALSGSVADGSSTYGDALAPGAVSFTNAVSGDAVSGTASVDTAGHLSTSGHLNAGSYTGVETVSGLSGADAGNYTAGTITGDYTVDPRVLNVAITGTPTRVYDGTRVANLVPGDFSVSGLVLGEQVQVTQESGTYASAEAGPHIAVSADLSAGDFRGIDGTDLANYSLPITATGFGAITQPFPMGSLGSPLQNVHVNRLTGLPLMGAVNVPLGVAPPETPPLEIKNGGVKGADDDAS